ncbi:MAG: hypothetical protein IIU55_08865, partial [Paludibacteraceae bacterium]|nr:hypothetical protein [Paludibacteraceae bacterium]
EDDSEVAPTQYESICVGDKFPWRGQEITTEGYHYAYDTLECGIVTYELHLTYDDSKCNPCENIEEIDLTKDLLLSQFQSNTWYKVDLAKVTGDLSVHFENDLTCAARVTAYTYATCDTANIENEIPLHEVENREIALGFDTLATCSYDRFLDQTSVYDVDGYAYIYVKEVQTTLTSRYAVIKDTICDGATYVDPITNEERVIASYEPFTLTWTSTKSVSPCIDSVYTFEITPVVAPDTITVAFLESIGAMPTLVAGKMVDVTGTIETILKHYEDNTSETVARVTDVYWTAGVDESLACDATSHTMGLMVKAGCNFEIPANDLVFDVIPVKVDTIGDDTPKYICSVKEIPEEYTHVEGDLYVKVLSTDPETGCVTQVEKQIFIQTVEPVWLTEAEVKALLNWNLVAGQAMVDTTGTAEAVIKGHADKNAGAQYAAIESVDWTSGYKATLDCEDTNLQMTLTITAGCNFSEPIIVNFPVNGSGEPKGTHSGVKYYCSESDIPNGYILVAETKDTYVKTTGSGCAITTDTIVVKYFQEPVWLTEAEVKALLNWNLVAGQAMVDTTGTAAAVKKHYATAGAQYAPIESVVWTSGYKATLDCEDTNLPMTLTITAGCNFSEPIIVNFPVNPATPKPTTPTVATICYETPYTWSVNNEVYSIDGGNVKVGYNEILWPETVSCGEAQDTLKLTVLPKPIIVNVDTTICYGDTLKLAGEEYSTSQVNVSYSIPFVGYTCDSVVGTLNLTVLPAAVTAPADNETICAGDSYTWAVTGLPYNVAGVYNDTVRNALGCDSIIYTLNLTVLPAAVTAPADNETICAGDSYTWAVTGLPYNVAGVYNDTVRNA